MEQSAPAPIRRIRQLPVFVQLVDAIERAGALDGDPRAGRKRRVKVNDAVRNGERAGQS